MVEQIEEGGGAPFYLESRHPGLVVDVAHEPVEQDLLRRVRTEFLGVVLGVLVVPHAHELLLLVAPGQDQRGDPERVLGRDLGGVRWRALEVEGVDADGHGADEAVVELLVEGLVSGQGDVDEAPLDVVWQRGGALEGDAEAVRTEEAGGADEKSDILGEREWEKRRKDRRRTHTDGANVSDGYPSMVSPSPPVYPPFASYSPSHDRTRKCGAKCECGSGACLGMCVVVAEKRRCRREMSRLRRHVTCRCRLSPVVTQYSALCDDFSSTLCLC